MKQLMPQDHLADNPVELLKDPSQTNIPLPLNLRRFYNCIIAGELKQEPFPNSPLLLSSPLPNAQDGNTPLHHALLLGYHDLAGQLLPFYQQHKLLDTPNLFKRTPLHLAALYGHHELFKQLLEAGASLDVVDEFSATPFYEACFGGSSSILKYLLAHTDPTVQSIVKKHCCQSSKDGWTPLIAAAFNHHLVIIDELLSYYQRQLEWTPRDIKQELQKSTNVGNTVFHMLVKYHEAVPLIHQLATAAGYMDTSLLNELLLQVVKDSRCEAINIPLLTCLCSLGAKLDCQLPAREIGDMAIDNLTPLHIAASRVDKDATLFFLEKNSDLKYKEDNQGRVPFDLLFKINYLENHQALVLKLSPYTLMPSQELQEVPFNQTLLILWESIRSNDVKSCFAKSLTFTENELVLFLTYKPYLLPGNNKKTLTLFQYLLIHCDEKILESALEYMASFSEKNRKKIINESSHHQDTLLHLAIRYCKSLAIIQKIVELGANLQARNHIDCTIIHEAACLNDDTIFNYLMEQCRVRQYPFYFEATRLKRWTPLLIACACYNDKIIAYLLEHSFINDINATNYLGESPLYLLIKANTRHIKNKSVLVEQLIKKGAALIPSNKGYDAVGIAILSKQYEVCEQLKPLFQGAGKENYQGRYQLTYGHLACIAELDAQYYPAFFTDISYYTYIPQRKRLPFNYLRSSQAKLIKYHQQKIKEFFLRTLENLSEEHLRLSVYQQQEEAYSFPKGSFDFLYIEQKKLHFVNKTGLIVKILKQSEETIKLITRPSRFGKSLALSMLYYFFDNRQNEKLIATLEYDPFEHYILNSDSELVGKHKGKYTVIFINFISLAKESYPSFIEELKIVMRKLRLEFSYLKEKMTDSEKEYYDEIFSAQEKNEHAIIANFTNILSELCNLIYIYNQKIDPFEKNHRHKPIILIDEFDAPLLKAAIKGKKFFSQVLAIVHSFLIASLKSQQNFEMAILSGIIRVSGNKLFSTLNSVSMYSSMKTNEFSNCFGFTEKEVRHILKAKGICKEFDKLRDEYGYYYCGNKLLFNPWSVIFAIASVNKENKIVSYKDHWLDSQRDSFVPDVIRSFSTQTRNTLLYLMKNNFIESPLTDNLSCIHPSQEISIIEQKYKKKQKTNYAFIFDKFQNKWSYRHSHPTLENSFSTEAIDEKNNPSMYVLLKKVDVSDIQALNEDAILKGELLKKIVETKQLIHLDETVWAMSLLYSAGFLTVVPFAQMHKQEPKEGQKFVLMIPNREIFKFYLTELHLESKDYPYAPRHEVIDKISGIFFTDEKIIPLLQQYKAKKNHPTLALFYQCSMLFYQNIPVDLLSKLAVQPIIAEFIIELEKPHLLRRAVENLNVSENVSSCIRNYFHDNRDEFLFLDSWTQSLVETLKEYFFVKDVEAFTNDYIQKQHLYYPHVRQFMELLLTQGNIHHQFPNSVILLYSLGRYELYIHAQFASAIDYFTQYLKCVSQLENKDIDFQVRLRKANAYRDRGVAYFQLNSFDEAVTNFLHAEQLYAVLLIEEENGVFKNAVLSQKAANYLHQARYFSALSSNDGVLYDAYEQAVAHYPPQVFEQMYISLERLIEDVRRGKMSLEQATATGKEYYQQILKNTPIDNKQTLSLTLAWASISYANLCLSSETDQKKQKAVVLLEQAERITIQVFGEDHFELVRVLTSQLKLGADYYPDWVKRYEKACRILEKSVKGKNNLAFSRLHMWVGLIYHRLGFPSQARGNAQEAKYPYENVILKTSSIRIALLNLEAESSLMMGDIGHASLVNQNALDIYEALYGNKHHSYCIMLNNKGEIALLLGHFSDAESLFREAYLGIKAFFGEHHVRTLRVYCNLVKAQFFQGYYAELYHKSEIILEKIEATHQRGYEDLLVAEIWYEYGRMFLSIGRMHFAQRFLEKAIDLLSPKYEKHPILAVYLSELMVVWACLGRFNDVTQAIRLCAKIFEIHTWQDYPAYQRFLVNVAYTLYLAARNQDGSLFSELASAMQDNLSLDAPTSIACLQKAIKKYDSYAIHNQLTTEKGSSEFKANKQVTYYGDILEARLLLGQCYFQQDKLRKAHHVFHSLAIAIGEHLSPAQHLKVELNYYLARTYLWLSEHDADPIQRSSAMERTRTYFTQYQGQLCHRYSPAVIHLTHDLQTKGLLGYVSLTRVTAAIRQEWKKSVALLPTEVYEQITHYQGFLKGLLKAGVKNITRQRRILAQLIILTYLSGEHELTQTYICQFEEGEGAGHQAFLQLLTLAAFIPTNIPVLASVMLPSIDALKEEEPEQKRLKAAMFHNLGCLYNVFAYHQETVFCEDGAEDSYKEAEKYFLKAIQLKAFLSPTVEYMNILYRRGEYEQVNTIALPAPDVLLQNLDFQTYSYVEKPILVDVLQPLISVNERISVHQGILAIYLRLRSLLASLPRNEQEVKRYFKEITHYRQQLSDVLLTSSDAISIYLLADITYKYLSKTLNINYFQEASQWVHFLEQSYRIFPSTHLHALQNDICEWVPGEEHFASPHSMTPGGKKLTRESTPPETPIRSRRGSRASASLKVSQLSKEIVFDQIIFSKNNPPELTQRIIDSSLSVPPSFKEKLGLKKELEDILASYLTKTYLCHFSWDLEGREIDTTYQIYLFLRCTKPWDHLVEWELVWELKQVLDKALSGFNQFIIGVRFENNLLSVITYKQEDIYPMLYRTLSDVLNNVPERVAKHGLIDSRLTPPSVITLLKQLKNKHLFKIQCEDAIHQFLEIAGRDREWRQFLDHLKHKNKEKFKGNSEHIEALLKGYHRAARLSLLEYQDFRSVLTVFQCVIDHPFYFTNYFPNHCIKFFNTLFYAAVLKGDDELSRQCNEQIKDSLFLPSGNPLESGIYWFVTGLWNENQAHWEEAYQAYQRAMSYVSHHRLWLVFVYYRISLMVDNLSQETMKESRNTVLTKAKALLKLCHPRGQRLLSLLLEQYSAIISHSPPFKLSIAPFFERGNRFMEQVGIVHPIIAQVYLDISDAWLIKKQYPFALLFAQLSYQLYRAYQPDFPLPRSYQVRYWHNLMCSYSVLLSHEAFTTKKQALLEELSKEVNILASLYYALATPWIELKKIYLQLLCLLEKGSNGKLNAQAIDRAQGGKVLPIDNIVLESESSPGYSRAVEPELLDLLRSNQMDVLIVGSLYSGRRHVANEYCGLIPRPIRWLFDCRNKEVFTHSIITLAEALACRPLLNEPLVVIVDSITQWIISCELPCQFIYFELTKTFYHQQKKIFDQLSQLPYRHNFVLTQEKDFMTPILARAFIFQKIIHITDRKLKEPFEGKGSPMELPMVKKNISALPSIAFKTLQLSVFLYGHEIPLSMEDRKWMVKAVSATITPRIPVDRQFSFFINSITEPFEMIVKGVTSADESSTYYQRWKTDAKSKSTSLLVWNKVHKKASLWIHYAQFTEEVSIIPDSPCAVFLVEVADTLLVDLDSQAELKYLIWLTYIRPKENLEYEVLKPSLHKINEKSIIQFYFSEKMVRTIFDLLHQTSEQEKTTQWLIMTSIALLKEKWSKNNAWLNHEETKILLSMAEMLHKKMSDLVRVSSFGSLHNEFLWLSLSLGEAYYRCHRYVKALHYAKIGWQYNSVILPEDMSADERSWYLNYCVVSGLSGEYKKAKSKLTALFTALQPQDPLYFKACNHLALLHWSLGEIKEAHEYCDKIEEKINRSGKISGPTMIALNHNYVRIYRYEADRSSDRKEKQSFINLAEQYLKIAFMMGEVKEFTYRTLALQLEEIILHSVVGNMHQYKASMDKMLSISQNTLLAHPPHKHDNSFLLASVYQHAYMAAAFLAFSTVPKQDEIREADFLSKKMIKLAFASYGEFLLSTQREHIEQDLLDAEKMLDDYKRHQRYHRIIYDAHQIIYGAVHPNTYRIEKMIERFQLLQQKFSTLISSPKKHEPLEINQALTPGADSLATQQDSEIVQWHLQSMLERYRPEEHPETYRLINQVLNKHNHYFEAHYLAELPLTSKLERHVIVNESPFDAKQTDNRQSPLPREESIDETSVSPPFEELEEKVRKTVQQETGIKSNSFPGFFGPMEDVYQTPFTSFNQKSVVVSEQGISDPDDHHLLRTRSSTQIPYVMTLLPDTGDTLWAEIDTPADNTCLFYAVALGTLLPVLNKETIFARRFTMLFGLQADGAMEELHAFLHTFDGSPDFIKRDEAQFEYLVNISFRAQVVEHMRKHPQIYKAALAIERYEDEDPSRITEDAYEAYLQGMASPQGTWGGAIEIGVMSELLGLPIITYKQEENKKVCQGGSNGLGKGVIRVILTKTGDMAKHNNHFHVLLYPTYIPVKVKTARQKNEHAFTLSSHTSAHAFMQKLSSPTHAQSTAFLNTRDTAFQQAKVIGTLASPTNQFFKPLTSNASFNFVSIQPGQKITPKLYFEVMSNCLNRLSSHALPEVEAGDEEIMKYLKAKLAEEKNVFIANEPWKLDMTLEEEGFYFMGSNFPYELFIKFLIQGGEASCLILPVSIKGMHYFGVVFYFKKNDNPRGPKDMLQCSYINPTSSGKQETGEDKQAREAIEKVIRDFVQVILPQLQAETFSGDLQEVTQDKSSEKKALPIPKELITESFRHTPPHIQDDFLINNLSCGQQWSRLDCGFIVAQTLVDMGKRVPLTISNFVSSPMTCIQKIAEVRQFCCPGEEQVKASYLQRLAKALAENHEYYPPLRQWLRACDGEGFKKEKASFIGYLKSVVINFELKEEGFKGIEGDRPAVNVQIFLQKNIKNSVKEIKEYCDWLLEPYFIGEKTLIFILNSTLSTKTLLPQTGIQERK